MFASCSLSLPRPPLPFSSLRPDLGPSRKPHGSHDRILPSPVLYLTSLSPLKCGCFYNIVPTCPFQLLRLCGAYSLAQRFPHTPLGRLPFPCKRSLFRLPVQPHGSMVSLAAPSHIIVVTYVSVSTLACAPNSSAQAHNPPQTRSSTFRNMQPHRNIPPLSFHRYTQIPKGPTTQRHMHTSMTP